MSEKERSLEWYKNAIRNGMTFQVRFAKSNMWPQYKAYYRHEFTQNVLPVNLVFSILRSLVPQTYLRNPSVSVTATKPGIVYEFHARLVEEIDRWLLRELMTKYEIKKMITDSFLCGISTGFIGYDSEFGFSQKHSLDQSGIASLTQFDKKGYRTEYNSNINPGMPWFLRARPEDVVFPWGCESMANAEWVAMRVFRPLEDLKADPKYKNTDKLAGSYTQRRTAVAGAVFIEDPLPTDHEWVELWQVHDAKTKEILGITMDADDFLRKEEDLMQIEGLPGETLVFNPDPDYIYGIPDARIIEPQLLELNEIRTQAMKHRRIDILKFLYSKGALTKDAIERLTNENVQAGVEVDSDMPISQAVLPFTPGASGILADMERMGEVIRGDVRETVGFSRVSTGEYQGKTHVSAKETDVVQWANQIRLDERRDMVADLLTNVVRKFNQIVFTHWTTSMVKSVVGPDGAKWWLQFTGPEIRSEYNIKIDPNDAGVTNPMTKKKDALDMASGYAQMNMGLAKSGVPAPMEIQRQFFSQFEGINIEKLMSQLSQMAGGGQPRPGAGQNPDQPVPPEAAAQMMMQQRGR